MEEWQEGAKVETGNDRRRAKATTRKKERRKTNKEYKEAHKGIQEINEQEADSHHKKDYL